MCPASYHWNGFVATHALGYMMYGYVLLLPINQGVPNKLSKEHNISCHKRSMTHRGLKSHISKMIYICLYMYYIYIYVYICKGSY